MVFLYLHKEENKENRRRTNLTLFEKNYEYKRNIEKIIERREKIYRMLKKAAVWAGLGLATIFGYEYLKGEEIMRSTITINGSEKCSIDYLNKKASSDQLHKCITNRSFDAGTLLFLGSEENQNKFYSKDLNEAVAGLLGYDSFLDKYVLLACINQNYNKIVQMIVKNLDRIDSNLSEETVYTLLHFATKNDWLAINKIIELANADDDEKRLHAMAALLFLEKNVMPTFLSRYKVENDDNRFKIIMYSQIYRDMYIKYYLKNDKLIDIFKKRLTILQDIEKDQRIKELILDSI
jgi:hypothetical protein